MCFVYGGEVLHVDEGTWVCGRAGTNVHGQGQPWVSFLSSYLIFETVIWGTQLQTDWRTNEFQEPSYLHLSSTGFTSAHHYA